ELFITYYGLSVWPVCTRAFCTLHTLVLFKGQCVPQLFFLGPQVSERVWVWRSFAGSLSDDLDIGLRQGARLMGIIREKANSADAEVMQDRGRQPEISAIGLEPESMIGLDRVETLVLKRVSLQL